MISIWVLGELLSSPAAFAQENESSVDSRGEVAIEGRAFAVDQNPETLDSGAGLFSRVEWTHDHSPFKERLRAFARVDRVDPDRSAMVVEEAWMQLWSGMFKLRAGVDIFNWTATEAFHPVDVLNARNVDGDFEALEKIGEPMVLLALSLPTATTLEFYALPAYMAPRPASQHSRLNPIQGVALGPRFLVDRNGRYTTGNFGPQAAIRVRQVLGSADVSLHVLEHMDRSEPVVVIDSTGVPRPVFFTVRQVGGTYQQAIGGVLLKLETTYRDFIPLVDSTRVGAPRVADHGKAALGLEYTIGHGNGAESSLIAEAQGVFGTRRLERLALTPFQRDVLAGYRIARNDEDGKELVVTGILDLERRAEFLLNLAYQQRLGDTWGLELGARVVHSAPSNNRGFGLAALRDADLVRLTVTRYF